VEGKEMEPFFGAMGKEKPIQILGLPAFLHGVNERF
jgi:hypothetical protein